MSAASLLAAWLTLASPPAEPTSPAPATVATTAPRDVYALDDAAFRALFSRSPVKRIGRDRFVRNVLYAIGNSGDPALAGAARALRDDPSEVVRDAADWALGRLAP